MLKSFFIFFLLLYSQSILFGQIKISKLLTDSITLLKEDRIVVLLETDTFKVISTHKRFINNCKQWIEKHNVEWDKSLLELFLYDCSNPVYAQQVTKTKLQKLRLDFRISDLLEEGDCLVIYKPTKQIIDKVIVEKYTTKYVSGRKFKTGNNHIILETVDSVF